MSLNPYAFIYKLKNEWRSSKDADGADISGLKPHEKLLLLSDGSLTLELELISGAPVVVEILDMHSSALSAEDAEYLSEPAGIRALNRTVWLKSKDEPLVFAHTILPEDSVEKDLKRTLEEQYMEPIGKVLTEKKIFFSKEKLQIGAVNCAQAAQKLNLNPDYALLARRYVLAGNNSSGDCIIKASVVEIFSPAVIEFR